MIALEGLAEKLFQLAADHPAAISHIEHAVENIAASRDPVDTARRAAMATVSAEASEEVLKRILGQSKP